MVTMNNPAQKRDWLDTGIKAIMALIVVVAIAFGGYYYYQKAQQKNTVFTNEIIQAAEKLVRANPRDINARVDLGRAYLVNERYDEAIVQFKEALKLDKENQAAIVFMGTAYMQKKDDDKALKQFALEIELYKSGGYARENNWLEQAYYNSAAIYWKRKRYEQALININEAANIKKADADVHFLAGRILYDKGSYEQASQAFDRALSFDINFADAAYGLAMSYEKLGEPGKAASAYKIAIKLKEDFKEATKAHDKLLEKLKSDLAKKPKDAKANYEMGMYYFGQEKYKPAKEHLDKAIAAKKDFLLAHFYLGQVFENQEQTEKAIEEYQKVLKIDPQFEKAKGHLEGLGVRTDDGK